MIMGQINPISFLSRLFKYIFYLNIFSSSFKKIKQGAIHARYKNFFYLYCPTCLIIFNLVKFKINIIYK